MLQVVLNAALPGVRQHLRGAHDRAVLHHPGDDHRAVVLLASLMLEPCARGGGAGRAKRSVPDSLLAEGARVPGDRTPVFRRRIVLVVCVCVLGGGGWDNTLHVLVLVPVALLSRPWQCTFALCMSVRAHAALCVCLCVCACLGLCVCVPR